MSNLSHDIMVTQTGGQPEPGGVVEGARRASKRTQSQEEWGSQTHSEPGGVVDGGQEDSQTHSEPGGVVEGARRIAKRTQSREEWWRGPEG